MSHATLRSSLMVSLAAALLHLALLAAYVAAPKFGGDVSALVCVSRERLDQTPFRHVRVGFPNDGYDGQAYYVIAQSPFQRHDSVHIDKPSYRHLRVLYQLLSWMLAGGDGQRLLWAMPAVNLLAIGALAGLGAHLASRWGRSPWWGLLLPLAVNAGSPALRNLTDPVSTCMVMLLMVAWLRRWPRALLALAALLALLAREQNLAVVGIIVVLAAGESDGRRVVGLLLASLAWAGWAILLWRLYDDSPFALGNFDRPLFAMVKRLLDPYHERTRLPIHLFGVGAMLVQMLACAIVVPWTRPDRSIILLGWAGAAMAALGSWAIWIDTHAYLRVFPWIPLALWLWAAHSQRCWPFLLTLPLMPWPLLIVLQAWR